MVVLFLELALRLQPVVQVTAVNSATFDVNLERSLTGFLPGMARSCHFPPRRLTEGCFLPRSEHPCLDLAISQSCLLLSVFD